MYIRDPSQALPIQRISLTGILLLTEPSILISLDQTGGWMASGCCIFVIWWSDLTAALFLCISWASCLS